MPFFYFKLNNTVLTEDFSDLLVVFYCKRFCIVKYRPVKVSLLRNFFLSKFIFTKHYASQLQMNVGCIVFICKSLSFLFFFVISSHHNSLSRNTAPIIFKGMSGALCLLVKASFQWDMLAKKWPTIRSPDLYFGVEMIFNSAPNKI